MKKKPITEDIAIVRLETLCAQSEQCSHELRQKLLKWGFESTHADRIIHQLSDNRFVDDNRFARAYVRDKYRFARWGRRKIIAGLYARRIDKSIIDEAIEEIDLRQYASIAFAVMSSKLRSLPAELPQQELRRKLLRFGLSRGYETPLLIKILQSNRLWESARP